MAISRLAKFITAIFYLTTITGCEARPKCPHFENAFIIQNWELPKPSKIEVQAFEKGSSFSKPIGEAINFNFDLAPKPLTPPSLVLKPFWQENLEAEVARDYTITIDGIVKYRISEIVSSERGDLGCPLRSARINQCQASAGSVIWFDMKC
jgi:hypothetical protein